MCHHVIGNLYIDLKRPADAVQNFVRAVANSEAPLREDSTNAKYRQNGEGSRRNLKKARELAAPGSHANGAN
jgi:hypothetical protein